jgi:hypothetical protein
VVVAKLGELKECGEFHSSAAAQEGDWCLEEVKDAGSDRPDVNASDSQ